MLPRPPSARLLAKQRERANATAETNKKDSSTVAKPPRKKQKATPAKKKVVAEPNVPRVDDFRKVRGRRGQLKAMTELPLDILTEIFGHLEPYDLLCLSRASKDLYAIIAGENTSSLWKKAYANLKPLRPGSKHQPPPCPPRESILRYTDFLFGRGCQFCNVSKASNIHWAARLRLCNKCAATQLIPIGWNAPALSSRSETQELCATSFMRKPRRQNYIVKQEHDRHIRALEKCVDDEAKARYKETQKQHLLENSRLGRKLQFWFSNRKYDQLFVAQQIRDNRRDAIKAKLTELGYSAEVERGRYNISLLPGGYVAAPLTDKEWDRIKTRIIGVYEWQRQETRKANMISILQKRMPYLTSLIEKSQEGLPKPWIYPPTSHIARLEPFASVMKEINEANLDPRPSLFTQHVGGSLYPNANVSLFQSVAAYNIPGHSDTPQMKENMDKLQDHIPGLVKAWRDDADKFLLTLLPNAAMQVDSEEIDRSPLELATTFFKCHCSCTEPISYPRILMHSCLRSYKLPDNDDDDAPQEIEPPNHDDEDEDDQENTDKKEESSTEGAESPTKPGEVYGIPTTTAAGVWNKMSSWWGAQWNEADMIELDDEAVGFARAIVQACGEDPDTTTAATLNERDVRVECTRCVPKKSTGRTRHVMTWKAAILHDIQYHFEETPTKTWWKLVTDEEELKLIHELEDKPTPMEKKRMRASYTVTPMDHCIYCDDQPPTNYGMLDINAYTTLPALGFVPAPIATASSINSEKSSKDAEEVLLKRHICSGIDAPMKAHPHPVKI